ncbi:MAG: hypothetical protein IPJ01_11965 [Micavibrio sp.]|nr:hypothetical protein [Micavibrio sp.]
MKNKNLYIGLGVLAVAGIGFYMWKKKQGESSETENKVAGKTETTPETTTPETKPEVKANAVANVASNAGNFISPRFTQSRFVPTRKVAKKYDTAIVAKTDVLDTLTKTNIGNIDNVSPRVAIVPLGTVGVGTVGGNVGGIVDSVPLGRIKSWGGRMLEGKKQCYDEAQSKYVDCPVQASNTGL